MMRYVWDEAKRLSNLAKHGLDFRDTWRVYEVEDKMSFQSPYPDEERFVDLAEVKGMVLLFVYTIRKEQIRCISYRPANRKEREVFYAAE